MRLDVQAALVRGELVPGDVEIQDGVVVDVGLSGGTRGRIAVPGFVDLQVNGYGGIDFKVAAGMTFADLNALATDYKFEADDTCLGGSPRFQVNVTDPVSGDSGNIFVYIGPPPAYTLCPPNVWLNTGDLLEGVNPIDTSQLNLGFFYDPYATALAKYGSYIVTGVQLVADGSWFFPFPDDGEQTVFIDNTNIDGTIYTYDEKGHPQSTDDCKNGGWTDLVNDDGEAFKNQGDCVSYVNNGK